MSATTTRDFLESQKQDKRSTEELIRQAVSDVDSDESDALLKLHCRGTGEVLDAAKALCASDNVDERCVGASILGQLGIPDRTFPEECFQILSKMLETEIDTDVLGSIGVAFGGLREKRAVPLLARLKNHPDSSVRVGVVHGLYTQADDLALNTLFQLMADEDDYVRNWATFNVGSLMNDDWRPVDSPAIRDALAARLSDSFDQVRIEAMIGLAERKDNRAIEPILSELTGGDTRTGALEAAEKFANPKFYPALLALKATVDEDSEDYWVHCLDDALAACKPVES